MDDESEQRKYIESNDDDIEVNGYDYDESYNYSYSNDGDQFVIHPKEGQVWRLVRRPGHRRFQLQRHHRRPGGPGSWSERRQMVPIPRYCCEQSWRVRPISTNTSSPLQTQEP